MELLELEEINPLHDDQQALAACYERDGCLLVRGLLDSVVAGAIAEQAGGVLQAWGVGRWTEEGPRWTGRPLDVLDRRTLYDLPALAGLVDTFDQPYGTPQELVDQICGEPMRLSRGAYVAMVVPDDPAFVASPHQDFHLHQADAHYRQIWIALTHIPFGDGGLALALGSHRSGRFPTRPLPGSRTRPTLDMPDPRPVSGVGPELVGDRWHTAAFEPGDGLLFSPDVVHCSAPPRSDRIRLALAFVATGAEYPQPPGRWTAVEAIDRLQAIEDHGRRLELGGEELSRIKADLTVARVPVDDATLARAVAGEYSGWREHSVS